MSRKKRKRLIILSLFIVLIISSYIILKKYNYFQENFIKIDKKKYLRVKPTMFDEIEIDLYINDEIEIEYIWIYSNSWGNEKMQYENYRNLFTRIVKHDKAIREDMIDFISHLKQCVKIKKINVRENVNNWYRLIIRADRRGFISSSFSKLIISENHYNNYRFLINLENSGYELNIKYMYEDNQGIINYYENNHGQEITQLSQYSENVSNYITYMLDNFNFLNIKNPTRRSNSVKLGANAGEMKIEIEDINGNEVSNEYRFKMALWSEYDFSNCFHYLFNFAQYNTISRAVIND